MDTSPIPPLDEAHLEELCNILGATETGLTGSEIGRNLARVGAADPDSGNTKRIRLYNALALKQHRDKCANNVFAFIQAVMNPVRHSNNHEYFEQERAKLNVVLAFSGYQLDESGQICRRQVATTLSEAQERAHRLKQDLAKRGVHPDVLRFCQAELLQDNYFHAVFEATKSVAEKIREKAGIGSDGAELVDEAFGLGKSGIPLLAFNSLQTETECSEHKGIANLMRGMFGTFRNVTAHAPKIYWAIGEQDALDLLSLASLLHRRLDSSFPTGRPKFNSEM